MRHTFVFDKGKSFSGLQIEQWTARCIGYWFGLVEIFNRKVSLGRFFIGCVSSGLASFSGFCGFYVFLIECQKLSLAHASHFIVLLTSNT